MHFMTMDLTGWLVSGLAVLLTGISKSGMGGALGGLAVPFMAIWLGPGEALAVMLPVLIAMDLAGIRAWRGKAAREELWRLVPAALVGIVLGSLVFGMLSERTVKGVLGTIAVVFAGHRLLRRVPLEASPGPSGRIFPWLCGVGSGVTSTLAHAGGPPVLIYLLTRRLSRVPHVATLVYFFTFINLAKLPFYIGIGLFSRDSLLMSLAFLPLVPVGVWLGTRLLAKIPERPFFLFATAALGISGIVLLRDALMV